MPRPPASLVLALLLATAVAACDLVAEVGTRTWGVATTNQAGTESTVSVTDRSGRVTDVTFDPLDAELFEPVSVPAGVPGALDITWTAGACDETTRVDIEDAGPGLAVTVTATTNGMGCDAMGIPRAIRLQLAGPVAPAAVSVSQVRP